MYCPGKKLRTTFGGTKSPTASYRSIRKAKTPANFPRGLCVCVCEPCFGAGRALSNTRSSLAYRKCKAKGPTPRPTMVGTLLCILNTHTHETRWENLPRRTEASWLKAFGIERVFVDVCMGMLLLLHVGRCIQCVAYSCRGSIPPSGGMSISFACRRFLLRWFTTLSSHFRTIDVRRRRLFETHKHTYTPSRRKWSPGDSRARRT